MVIDDAIAFWDKIKDKEAMHPVIKDFVTLVYDEIKYMGIDFTLTKKNLIGIYFRCIIMNRVRTDAH